MVRPSVWHFALCVIMPVGTCTSRMEYGLLHAKSKKENSPSLGLVCLVTKMLRFWNRVLTVKKDDGNSPSKDAT